MAASLPDKKDKKITTHCYTYEVTMLIQVLADDEKTAREQLDKQGGYVTKREVVLADSVALFNGVKAK
jgi:hypothetical protein